MCAAGACTGGAEPLILNIICILRERDGHGMTTFIMGHGQYKGPDTFVPIGMLVGVYADVDTYLAMSVGMAVLAQEGGYKSAYSYSSTEDKISGIHNYKIDPLTAPEYQKMIAVNSQKNNIIYIGYEGNYEGGTYLCTGDYSTCHDGRHGCTGILGQVKDTDVRLAFCILPTSRLGMATMTDRLPEEGEYASANQNLAEWQEKAKNFYEKIQKQEDPGKDIKEFNAWAVQNNKNQREAAFILSSYRPLEEFLALYEARMQRQSLGAGPFLSYLNGLPEETRDLVSKGLREEQRSGGSNQNQDGQSVSDKFIESFFMASTQERYKLWNSLSEDERATVKGNSLIKDWANMVVPAVAYYTQMALYEQPMGAVIAFAWKTGLSEHMESEARDCDGWRMCQAKLMGLAQEIATAQQKLDLWNKLAAYPEAQKCLTLFISGSSDAWQQEVRQQQTAVEEGSAWSQLYALRQSVRESLANTPVATGANTVNETQRVTNPVVSPEEYLKSLANDEFEYVRAITSGVIHVLRGGNDYRIIDRTSERETACPAGLWGTFTAVPEGLDDVVLTPQDAGNIDLAKFGEYLVTVNERAYMCLKLAS